VWLAAPRWVAVAIGIAWIISWSYEQLLCHIPGQAVDEDGQVIDVYVSSRRDSGCRSRAGPSGQRRPATG
jgi:hypothetical protein